MRNKILWFIAAASLLLRPLRPPSRHGSSTPTASSCNRRASRGVAVKLPGWHWAHEPYACPPAIAIGPRGEALVTSNVLPVLWKIDPQTLAVTVHSLELDADSDKDVGFSGLVYSARDGAYFAVSELHGSLWRIDPLLRRAQKIALVGAGARRLCAVDAARGAPQPLQPGSACRARASISRLTSARPTSSRPAALRIHSP